MLLEALNIILGQMNAKARIETLTAVLMKIQVFWDTALCRWVSRFRRFKGSYCLHLHGLGLFESVKILVGKSESKLK